MCTLILGIDVAGPDTVIAGANRDEDPARPSDPPGVLVASPRVVGGRDRRAGGTWLALREGRLLVAMLNRRDSAAAAPTRRSRGLLALEVAAGPDAAVGARPAIDRALEAVGRDDYAPFSLVVAAPESCWLLAHEPPHAPRASEIGPGWHVLTHTELDDPREPRAARLLRELSGWEPLSPDEALHGLAARLREHGTGTPGEPAGPDAVCVHAGRMVTVSSTRIGFDRRKARYLHVEGRPCVSPEVDHTSLLSGDRPRSRSAGADLPGSSAGTPRS